ncbi:hypothetical protein [Mycolicibacterium elephantis]
MAESDDELEPIEPQKPWSAQARDDVLAGISLAREFKGGGRQFAIGDAFREVLEAVRGPEAAKNAEKLLEAIQNTPDAPAESVGFAQLPEDAIQLAGLVVGLTRLTDILLDWIERDAANRKTLLADIRKMFPDYDEPEEIAVDPRFSTWGGVLKAIEASVRNGPVSD